MLNPFRSMPIALAIAASLAQPVFAQVHEPLPFVERIEPTSGPPGTTVQMVGRYFRPAQSVRLGSVALEVQSRTPNRWTLRIPDGATSGRILIDAPSMAQVVGPEFRVLPAPPPPAITDIQPRSAAPGAEVRVVGENFSPRITENIVTLGAQPVVVRTATPTELMVIVPQGASTGRFTVRVGTAEASAPMDLVIGTGVQITRITPAIAAPGSRIRIEGVGFAARATGNRVQIGTTAARIASATPTVIELDVPAHASTGIVSVEVPGTGRAYSAQPLTIQAAPTIATIDPPAGPPGSQFRIRGTNFGADVRVVQVMLGTASATVRGLTPTEITAEVPANASSAAIAVTVNGVGPATSHAIFTVLTPPRIADFAPRFGGPGSEVTITGAGFSSSPRANRVTISGAACEVISASANELRIRVPRTASGPVIIEVEHAGNARTAEPFVVTNPPTITRIDPERATPGSAITIEGANFGTNLALLEVSVGDRRMEVRSVANDRIAAVIPQNAINGRIRVTVRLQGTATSDHDFLVLGEFAFSAIEPTTAYPGQHLTIRGVGFSAEGMQVHFTGVRDPVSFDYASPTELRLIVPNGAATGPLTVRSADGRDATQTFTLATPPAGIGISEIAPACTTPRCTLVVVRGYGFAAQAARNRVTVGTTRVRVRRASPYELEFELPRTPGTMTIRVEANGATAESAPLTMAP